MSPKSTPKPTEPAAYALADPSGTITLLPEGTSRDDAVQIGRANHDNGIALGELADGQWTLVGLGSDWERPEVDAWGPPADIDPLSAAAVSP